jgi:hypothetical protein
MNNDARIIFKDWINSPSYTSKLKFELYNSSSDFDEYRVNGLTSRFKWVVGHGCGDIYFDFSGIVESSDELLDINYGFYQGYTVTPDNFYIIENPASDYTVIQYPSVQELVIAEYAHAIAWIEKEIEKHSYMFIAANDHGGSVAHLKPIDELNIYINRMLADRCRQDPATVTYPHFYFAPLVKQKKLI